ncbi:MAG: hypothetical protein II194_07465 [Bacteroidales bacterium]|nr:hypothetical protein [Bacteroidales bacterium]
MNTRKRSISLSVHRFLHLRESSITPNIRDRFMIVDDDVYHIGASMKDLGKKLFAFSRLGLSPAMLLSSG